MTDLVDELLHSLSLDSFNSVSLAAVLECSDKTAMRKIRNTELLTVGDIRKILSHMESSSNRGFTKEDAGLLKKEIGKKARWMLRKCS